jgi:formylglycine-generating enzyme required for sulfatase activity
LWTSDSQQPPSEVSTAAEPFFCTYGEATHVCALLSQQEGIQLELPSADQWEMAARGPDGRRYPWGNCLKQSGLLQPSPWMVRNMVGHAYEWTRDWLGNVANGGHGNHIVCGGQAAPACSRRQAINPGDSGHPCAVRPVFNWAEH